MKLAEKIEKSCKTLILGAEMSKTFYSSKLVLCHSGGKDSECMLGLAQKCLSPDDYEVVHSHTTLDAPPTVYHIRNVFAALNMNGVKTNILYPQKSMWELIIDKGMPPTRLCRYCCKELKEISIPNRMIAVGVRAEESFGRKGRAEFSLRGKTKEETLHFTLEHSGEVFHEALEAADATGKAMNEMDVSDCTLIAGAKAHKDIIVNPIYDWTENEVWNFIRLNKILYNPLYDMGYTRVGCIGCPNASWKQKKKEFADFPEYKVNYIRAFQKMIERRHEKGLPVKDTWKSGEDVFNWWTEEYKHNCKGQMTIFDYMESLAG